MLSNVFSDVIKMLYYKRQSINLEAGFCLSNSSNWCFPEQNNGSYLKLNSKFFSFGLIHL